MQSSLGHHKILKSTTVEEYTFEFYQVKLQYFAFFVLT